MIRDYDLLRVGDLAVDDYGIVRVTEKEARREAMKLDDNEDSLEWRYRN